MLSLAWINSIIHVLVFFTCIYGAGVFYRRTTYMNVPFLLSCVGILYASISCLGMVLSGKPANGNIYTGLAFLVGSCVALYDSRLIHPRFFR